MPNETMIPDSDAVEETVPQGQELGQGSAADGDGTEATPDTAGEGEDGGEQTPEQKRVADTAAALREKQRAFHERSQRVAELDQKVAVLEGKLSVLTAQAGQPKPTSGEPDWTEDKGLRDMILEKPDEGVMKAFNLFRSEISKVLQGQDAYFRDFVRRETSTDSGVREIMREHEGKSWFAALSPEERMNAARDIQIERAKAKGNGGAAVKPHGSPGGASGKRSPTPVKKDGEMDASTKAYFHAAGLLGNDNKNTLLG